MRLALLILKGRFQYHDNLFIRAPLLSDVCTHGDDTADEEENEVAAINAASTANDGRPQRRGRGFVRQQFDEDQNAPSAAFETQRRRTSPPSSQQQPRDTRQNARGRGARAHQNDRRMLPPKQREGSNYALPFVARPVSNVQRSAAAAPKPQQTSAAEREAEIERQVALQTERERAQHPRCVLSFNFTSAHINNLATEMEKVRVRFLQRDMCHLTFCTFFR